jgi:hypothetical protein
MAIAAWTRRQAMKQKCTQTRRRPMTPMTNVTMKTTRKMKNKTWAIPADADAIPPNPNNPAITATMKNTIAQYNMTHPPLWIQ